MAPEHVSSRSNVVPRPVRTVFLAGLVTCILGTSTAVAQSPAPAQKIQPSAAQTTAQGKVAPKSGAEQPPAPPATPPEVAPPTPPPTPPPPVLSPVEMQSLKDLREPAESAKTNIEAFANAIERNKDNDEELGHLRGALIDAVRKARDVRESLQPKLDALHQQIEKLGPPPAKDAAPESDQVAGERARLTFIAADVDGALKTAELAIVRGRQLYGELQAARQKLFANQVLKRNPSPLAPATWMQLLEDLPAGWRQVVDTLDEWLRSASGKWPELAGLLGGIALAFLVLTALVRRFLAYRLDGPREEPPGFFMQASAVGWVAPVLAVPSLAVIGMLAIGLDSLDLLTFEVGQIADVAFPALVMFAVVSALARAIL
jgi:small-conductance mechanosensitive channel